MSNEYAMVITPAGFERLMALFAGKSTTAGLYMAVGTGTTPPTKNDGLTAMEHAVYRAAATIVQSGATGTWSLTVPAGTVSTSTDITELAIFDAASAGNMLARATRAPVTITATKGQVFAWPISFEGGYGTS